MPVSPDVLYTFSVSRTHRRRRGMLRTGASFWAPRPRQSWPNGSQAS